MELLFGQPNILLTNNKSTRIKYPFWKVIPKTIANYFFWNYENIYFLILALFQLATLSLIPKEWSPTGPYSTVIPLFLCVAIEILTNLIKYYKDLSLDNKENNTIYQCYDPQRDKLTTIKNKDIYPGHIIHLQKDNISPVDGILVDTSNNEKSSKISLALLTGESNLHYVVKPYKFYKNKDYINSNLNISDYYPTDFHNLTGQIINADKGIPIKGDNFIVAGSIIKSDDVYIWVTACGSDKKSHLKYNRESKSNTMDMFVGNYMMKVNAKLLVVLVMLLAFVKMCLSKFSLYNLVFYGIQNWILFNGIIPFSIKILLIISRSMQSQLVKEVVVNNATLIDDIGKVTRILSDKTGTITKNELEFTCLLEVFKDNIINVESYANNNQDISLDFHKCLGLCIHQIEDDYSTAEDKTIRYRYQFLNNRVTQFGNHVTLTINNNNYDFKYVEIGGLDFTFERKMSSKIVQYNNKYYIYSKGSMDMIYSKLHEGYKQEFKRLDKLISTSNPELRLLACAFREINKEELDRTMANSISKSALVTALENNLNLIGIVGIKDNLQDGIKETIRQLNVPVCLLTGDRKITAIAIGKEAGLIKGDIFDCTPEHYNFDSTISQKTLVFNGSMLGTHDMVNHLLKCKNFIGYSLIPDHKKKIAEMLENNNIKTLAVGDGFNDIGMFTTSSMSVAIQGNTHVESQADFAIKEFKNIVDLYKISYSAYNNNSNLINFTFYRCSMVTLSLLTYCLINYNETTSLFNGFVLQAFNFAWLLPGLAYYTIKSNDIKNNVSMSTTTAWNISGIITGILLTIIHCYYFSELLSDIFGLVLISILNIKLITANPISMFGMVAAYIGIWNYFVYLLCNGTLLSTIAALCTVGPYYWLSVISTYLIVDLCII